MSNCLTPVLCISFLLAFTIGQEGLVCRHERDVTVMWLIQCVGLNSSNAGELKWVLKDAYRIMPNKKMIVELTNSDGAAVPEGVFDDYWIETLTMTNCNLTSLPFHLIANISVNLLVLQLRDNHIATVDFKRFNEVPFASKLEYLGLGNNLIASMPEDALVNFTAVDTLDLRNNVLEELVDNTFRGMLNLKNLHLLNNQIHSVGQNAFADLQNLYLLTVDQNKISFLEEGTLSLQNQASLREVPLEGNPFYCNCTLQWLKDYLSSIHYLEFSGATCVFPQVGKFVDIDFCAVD